MPHTDSETCHTEERRERGEKVSTEWPPYGKERYRDPARQRKETQRERDRDRDGWGLGRGEKREEEEE